MSRFYAESPLMLFFLYNVFKVQTQFIQIPEQKKNSTPHKAMTVKYWVELHGLVIEHNRNLRSQRRKIVAGF